MASVTFEWDRSGYAELMNSAAVQSVLEAKAQAVKASADAAVTGHRAYGYSSGPHGVGKVSGKLANGYYVGTRNNAAKYMQAKRNTLKKALDSLGGD